MRSSELGGSKKKNRSDFTVRLHTELPRVALALLPIKTVSAKPDLLHVLMGGLDPFLTAEASALASQPHHHCHGKQGRIASPKEETSCFFF